MDFRFVPGVSALKEDTYVEGEETWQYGLGFYQRLTAKMDKTWTFTDSLTYRHDFRANDLSVEASASFTGALTKTVGLQVQYEYYRETFVPPGIAPYQQTMQVGLQVKF